MKILLTTDWYRPAINGVVTSVLNLRTGLEARGHEVRILTLSQSLRSGEESGVYRVGSLPAGLIYPGIRLRSALAGRQIRELLDWGPDVIHSQCEFSTFFLARKLAESLDVPLVHTYHTVYEDYTHYFSPSVRLGRKAAALFTRWIAAQTDCLIAPTEKVRRLLRGYLVSAPIRVIPTGIRLEQFQTPFPEERRAAFRALWGLDPSEPVMISVGRLAEEKNIPELIRCAGDLGVPLVLAGGGPDRERLEALAESIGVRALFPGQVAPEETADWYRLGDLFVSASSSETQGLTYLEALAAGVPALCREDPCLRGVIVNGVNGWQYRDAAEFRRLARQMLSRPELLRQMSRQAVQSAADFSLQTFARRMEETYRSVIRRHNLEVSA